MDLDTKKNLASNWFRTLQNALCESIIKLENSKTEFKATTWERNKKKEEGGGEYRILKDGRVFDKVGVNFSKVYGKFPIRLLIVLVASDPATALNCSHEINY